ncbi:LysM peptidoglycan-binding domain-containing protein [bacterium]|nr:MAG: LysM peptidoglycan-binding domain-containing protein [bacterium]
MKQILKPTVLPIAVVVLFIAVACGRNISLANRKQNGDIAFGSVGKFFGGGEDVIEDGIDSAMMTAGLTSDFELASVAQASFDNSDIDTDNDVDISENYIAIGVNSPELSRTGTHYDGIVKYVVSAGDTISGIAQKFGVSANSVLWANNLYSTSIIKSGDVLEILPISGVKHVVKSGNTLSDLAKLYKADAEEIAFYNNIEDGQLKVTSTIIVPGGVLPNSMLPQPVLAKTIMKNAPAYTSAGQGSGYFIYPAAGHNWGRIHASNGIDISNPKGGPIYAAAAGTVILADGSGYNGGYGEYIKIQHPNGVVTLYGHLSKILVTKGQDVSQGTVIGMMGNTGRSTGTHLHFEVRGAKNPLARY